MTTAQIKNILQKPYDPQRTDWHNILRTMFKRVTIFERQTQVLDNQDNVQRGGQFGIVELEDGKNIALFEVEVADNVRIAKNRVALREITINFIDSSKIHGALVFYFNKNQWEYRLSFMAQQNELTEGGRVTTQTQPKRFTYLLGENEPCTTPAKRISELIAKNLQDFIGIKNVIEAFSVEKLSKQFFTEYKEIHYSKFIAYLTGEDHKSKTVNEPQGNYLNQVFGGNKKEAREFVKKLLGRTIFMFFLQKKGWLGCDKKRKDWKEGDAFFVQNLFKKCHDQSRFHSQYLTELFYNALNKDRRKENDYFALTDSRVPFLNGGLFEKDHKYDTAKIDFPSDYFQSLLDFFEQYNFTIDENSPDEQEVGIDPEMLGHIFENLLEDNKDKGAFYTPKEIVHYMCQESLIQFLTSNSIDENSTPSVSAACIEQLVREKKVSLALQDKNKASDIKVLLNKVKICDPAIGSGAFPIGLLQEIFHCLHLLHPHIEPNASFDAAKTKKDIIQNSIYGVDKDGGAVDIARLRFWLALVVDEDVPQPLPNLDYKIMQGDSLLERYAGIDLKFEKVKLKTTVYEPPKKQTDLFGNILNPQISFTEYLQTNDETVEFDITELEDKFFNSDNPEEKKTIRGKLETFERNFIQKRLDAELDKIELQIAKAQRELTQFQKDYTTKIQANDKNALSKQTKLQKALDMYEAAKVTNRHALYDIQHGDTNNKPYFLWYLYFMDVFDEGGFDIVIGNPPYVQLREIDEKLQEYYLETEYYKFAKGGRLNLYQFFIPFSIEIASKGGIVCLITQNSVLAEDTAINVRKYIFDNSKIIQFDSFPERDNVHLRVFESVKMSVAITTIQRNKDKNKDRNEDFKVNVWKEKYMKEKNELVTNYQEISELYPDSLIIPITSSANIELIKLIKKISNVEYLDSLAGEVDMTKFKSIFNSNKSGLRVLTGAQVQRYHITDTPSQGGIIYLEKNTIPKTGKFLYIEDERIVMQRITGVDSKIRLIATKIPANHLCANSTNIIICKKSKLNYVLGIINSRLINFYFKLTSTNTNITNGELNSIPIPQVEVRNQITISQLVDYQLFLNNKNNPQPNNLTVIIDFFERVIDGCVFELYFEEHMKERDITIIKEVAKHLINIEDLTSLDEKRDAIYRSYNALKNSEVNEKLQLFAVRSPDILLPILRG